MRIVIYRTTENKRPRSNKAERQQSAEQMACARVKRPDLAAWIMDGGLYNLDTLPSAERSTPALREVRGSADRYGYTVADLEVGRTGRIDRSTANSIRLWIEKNLGPYCRVSDLMVTAEPY
jgi:hypothetical protein